MADRRLERAPGGSPPGDGVRPSEPQRRYLERGLSEPGGKLPLFDRDGRQIPRKTVEACVAHGWAEPWTANPIKSDWLVCKLTSAGYRALGIAPHAGNGAREKSTGNRARE
jgi:hypothetical protein